MESLVASLFCVIAALSVVIYSILRRQQQLELNCHDLSSRLTELESRQALDQLPAKRNATEHAAIRRSAADPLEQIEQLADPLSLNDSHALAAAANELASLPAGVAANLFDANEKSVAITRLIQHGHSLHEISRRLHIPLGEVELLASIRVE